MAAAPRSSYSFLQVARGRQTSAGVLTYVKEVRDHCSFLSASIDVNVSGQIDGSLEASIRGLHAALRADSVFQLKLAWPQWGIKVRIKSLGGDLDAALRIGRMLRDLQAYVEVEEECSSACVFLLAGAALRGPLEAKIGIHRPYFRKLSTKAAPNAVSRAYKDHRQRIAQFLADMNVPASLLDAMDSVPPEQSRYLTKAELITYRLDGPDRAFEERGTARDAAQCHITLAEMRQRNKDAE